MKVDILLKDATPEAVTRILGEMRAVGSEPAEAVKPAPAEAKGPAPVAASEIEFEEVVTDGQGNDYPTVQECVAAARKVDPGKHRQELKELVASLAAEGGKAVVKEIPPERRAEFLERVRELQDA